MPGTTGSQQIPHAVIGDARRTWPAKSQEAAERIDELLDAIGTALAGKAATSHGTHVTAGSIGTAQLADDAVTADKADSSIATAAALSSHAASGHVSAQPAIADLAAPSVDTPADTPVDADALRDDLVAGALADITTALGGLTTKLNAVLAALRDAGVITT